MTSTSLERKLVIASCRHCWFSAIADTHAYSVDITRQTEEHCINKGVQETGGSRWKGVWCPPRPADESLKPVSYPNDSDCSGTEPHLSLFVYRGLFTACRWKRLSSVSFNQDLQQQQQQKNLVPSFLPRKTWMIESYCKLPERTHLEHVVWNIAVLCILSLHSFSSCTYDRFSSMYLWWSFCIAYLLACQVRVTVADSGDVSGAVISSFVCWFRYKLEAPQAVLWPVMITMVMTAMQ